MKKSKSYYHPAVNFEKVMLAFILFLKERRISHATIETATLESMHANQLTDAAEIVAAERAFREGRREFLRKQAECFGAFMRALELTRAMYRDDPEALRSLRQFKGTPQRSRHEAGADEPGATAPPKIEAA